MGQRHQIYLNVPNPTKILRDEERKHGTSIEDTRIDEKFRMFGCTKREIILPFHNQWLYGRRAPLSALRILKHCSTLSRWDKLGNPKHYNYTRSPLAKYGIESTYDTFDEYMSTLQHIMNFEIGTKYQDIEGVGKVSSTRFEGDESYKVMSEAFDMGDNNDGITIIDTITNKYCFMNINNYSYGDGTDEAWGVDNLKPYTPVSAREYMRAYYGESKGQIAKHDVVRSKKTAIQIARENKNANRNIDREFKGFEVMTLDEVKLLFPKMDIPQPKGTQQELQLI